MRYEVIPAITCNDTKLSNEIINGLQKEKNQTNRNKKYERNKKILKKCKMVSVFT